MSEAKLPTIVFKKTNGLILNSHNLDVYYNGLKLEGIRAVGFNIEASKDGSTQLAEVTLKMLSFLSFTEATPEEIAAQDLAAAKAQEAADAASQPPPTTDPDLTSSPTSNNPPDTTQAPVDPAPVVDTSSTPAAPSDPAPVSTDVAPAVTPTDPTPAAPSDPATPSAS
jgi:hypothetical protein